MDRPRHHQHNPNLNRDINSSSPSLSAAKAVLLGLTDSIIGIKALFPFQQRPSSSSKKQEEVAINGITKCCLLNGGVFGVSLDFLMMRLIDLLFSFYILRAMIVYIFRAIIVYILDAMIVYYFMQ